MSLSSFTSHNAFGRLKFPAFALFLAFLFMASVLLSPSAVSAGQGKRYFDLDQTSDSRREIPITEDAFGGADASVGFEGSKTIENPVEPVETPEPFNATGSEGTPNDGDGKAQPALELIQKLFPSGGGNSGAIETPGKPADGEIPSFGGLEQTLDRVRKIREKLSENRSSSDTKAPWKVSPSGRPEFRTQNGRPPEGRSPYEVRRDEEGLEGYFDERGNYFRGLPLHLLNDSRGGTGQSGSASPGIQGSASPGIHGSAEEAGPVLFPTGGDGGEAYGGSELFPR